MAQAEDADIIAAWPPEGVSLRESLRRTPGWPEYEKARAKSGFGQSVGCYPPKEAHTLMFGPNLSACETWLWDRLKSGVLVLACLSLERPFAGPDRLTFPAATIPYLRLDWLSEIVLAPNKATYYGPLILSARSVPATAEPQREQPSQIADLPQRQATAEWHSETAPQTAIRSNKDWYVWAAKNIPPADDLRKYGAKRHHAKKLAAQMNIDAKTNKNIKPRLAQTIAAHFNAFDLWPKRNDENTTK
jgi:hypothetical protein